jgi:hypothetical protein
MKKNTTETRISSALKNIGACLECIETATEQDYIEKREQMKVILGNSLGILYINTEIKKP